MTERLYWLDPYLTEFDAQVVDVKEVEEGYAYLLDRTAFYPGGGGLPPDEGILGGLRVRQVWEDRDGIWHVVNDRLEGTVHGEIDFNRRYRYMTVHTAQHLISAVAYRLFEIQTVSMHLSGDGVSYVVFDGNFDVATLMEHVWDAVGRAPAVKWRLVRRGEPLPPMRRSVRWDKVKGDFVRLVEIEDYDVVPCGGLHVGRLSEISPVVPVGISKKKGYPAFEFVAGPTGRDYLLGVAQELRFLRVENQELRSEISALKRKLIEVRVEQMAQQITGSFGVLRLEQPEMLSHLAKKLARKGATGLLVAGDRFAVVGDEGLWKRIQPAAAGGGSGGLWFGKITDRQAFETLLKGGDRR